MRTLSDGVDNRLACRINGPTSEVSSAQDQNQDYIGAVPSSDMENDSSDVAEQFSRADDDLDDSEVSPLSG